MFKCAPQKQAFAEFFKPEEVHLGRTTVEGSSSLRLHRAVGCEYVNAYNAVVMERLKCNHDAQFVFSGSRDTAAYVAKYCFKHNQPGASTVRAENALERYWKRDPSLENVSFMEICEKYEYSGKDRARTSSKCSSDRLARFSKMQSPKDFVLSGVDIPDIMSLLDDNQQDYYYITLLTLFNPHREYTLSTGNRSFLGNCRSFLKSGDPAQVRMLLKYEAQWQDYYHAQRNGGDDDESLEDQLVRMRSAPTSSWVPDQDDRSNSNADIDSAVDQIPKTFSIPRVTFEVATRNLLYAYSKDIDDVIGDASDFPQYQSDPFKIKSQLIAYLGGEAWTGKSTIVEALLAMAKRCGREGSVETLAFTGAAAINIHGKTTHSAHNLQLNGAGKSVSTAVR
ncbi:hypothetical protein ON010_g2202 [Phytophthora cinnamomi]|nr:hypothetical protein ON010_g2202 [Phytophthora cinnamomi]